MNLESILSQKSCNRHYLKRYLKFISACKDQIIEKYEAHHICPKASDMFPEYSSFKANQWNKCNLTTRQHYVAHWLLWKTFGGSQTRAFWRFNQGSQQRISSRSYEQLKSDFSRNQSALMKNKPKSKDHHEKLKIHLSHLNQSEEQRSKVKERMTGRNVSTEERNKIANGVSKHLKNTIWINDGLVNKRILNTEPINDGWTRGRLMSKDQVSKMQLARKH